MSVMGKTVNIEMFLVNKIYVNIFTYHQISFYNLILTGCIVFHYMDMHCAIIKLTLDIYVVSFNIS